MKLNRAQLDNTLNRDIKSTTINWNHVVDIVHTCLNTFNDGSSAQLRQLDHIENTINL